MKARNLFIFLLSILLLITSTYSADDSCPSGMRKTYVDDLNMVSYGSARKWLAAVCYFQLPGSLFFQRKVLIEPRFEVHLKAAVNAIDVVESSDEQKIHGFTIVISGNKNTISGLNGRSYSGSISSAPSKTFADIGYNNFVNALIVEFDFVKDYSDPAGNSFSIRYCSSSCDSSDSNALHSQTLTVQNYVAGQKNEWDFRLVYQNKALKLYSGSNNVLHSLVFDLESYLDTNIAYVGFTGFMESNRGEINLMGTFMCEDNYALPKMVGYFYDEPNLEETHEYEPEDTIYFAFYFINNQGEKVPHTYGYGIWNYSFYATKDCDSKGIYTISKLDNYTLILTIPACTTIGQHSITLNEDKKGTGTTSYYTIIAGDMTTITLAGYNGNIGTVPVKSDTDVYYLNYGGSTTGDFIYEQNLKIVLDFKITDKYGNKVTVSNPDTLFTLVQVNSDGSTSVVNTNILSYILSENGNYYQMNITVTQIGTYQIVKNEYMDKAIKFTIIPGEADATNSYCNLDNYAAIPTVEVGKTLNYICYLRDSNGNEIPINTFIQNSKYEFSCALDKTWPSSNSYSPSISNLGTSYSCSYSVSEIGNFAYNGYLKLKTTKETTKITPKVNQFYVRGDPENYTIKKILNPSTKEWLDIDTYTNTKITYVADSKGFITAIDFAESSGDILISSYNGYPDEFNINNLKVVFSSTHDESFNFGEVEGKLVTLDGKTYVGIYTKSGESTDNLIKKSSFDYYLKFTYNQVEKSASITYTLNIGSYVTCFHALDESKTKVNIDDNIELLTGGDETKLGKILLSTNDNNLYNYDIGTSNIKTRLNPTNNNLVFRVVASSIEGTYDIYAKSTQDYEGDLEILINDNVVKTIKIISEPSQACYLDWINPEYFTYQSTNGKELYYEYIGDFDNGNLLINFKLKDKFNNTIEKEDYFTKYPDISSEEYGSDTDYFNVSFESNDKSFKFRDNIPYENKQRGWVFTMRESTCNYKYYLRYDGKKGGSPLELTNSYFNLLNTEIYINYNAYVEVIYKDKNNQNLGLQEEKLEDAKSRTKVIATNTEGYKIELSYDSTTSNYALRYKANFTVSGTYYINVTLDSDYLNYENTNQLKVIDNIYDLASSKLKMISDSIIDMSTDIRTTIDNNLYEPYFQLYFYSKDNVKTNYDKNVIYKLELSGTNMPQSIEYKANKNTDEYIQFNLPDNEIEHFHNLKGGDYQLTLSDNKATLIYPVLLKGDNNTDYSNDQNYDITKTEVNPTKIDGIAGKTYSINIEFRASDGLRWNYIVETSDFEISYSQSLNSDQITIKTELGPKKGQLIVFVTQTKVTTDDPNILSFKYKNEKITTNVALNIKCAQLDHLTLIEGPTEGNVITPPKIIFEPRDAYENLYTDLFTSSVTQDEINSLTVGSSLENVILTSNNSLNNNKVIVQYTSTISTDVVVTSEYFDNSYNYRIYSGPIDEKTSYAEIKSETTEVGGEYILLIYPKDLYNNDIDGLNEEHLAQFKTVYQTVGLDDSIDVNNCYLVETSSNNVLRNLIEEDQENIYSKIECKATITKAGTLQFVTKYLDYTINCKDQCQFVVIPNSIYFENTKVYYTNKEVYLTLEGPNEVEIGTTPIFELSFYDKYQNQLDEDIVNNLNIDATLDDVEVKLCVSNNGKTKTVTICPSSNGDDNENKFKYLTNGNYNLIIQDIDDPNNIVEYPLTITGGSSDGSSDKVDFSKTDISPNSLNLIAGKEDSVVMELRTSKRQRKNYWYPEPSEVIKISFENDADTCSSNVEKGDLPGRYVIKVTCTKTTNLNRFSITVESTTLDEKVQLFVNSSSAYYLEVEDLDKFTASSDKYTWKENPSNDDTISFSFKFKDKYQNYITYNLIGSNEFSIGSETYGSGVNYNIEFNTNSYNYLFTDTIADAITKHTWNIIVVESNRKYSFIYTKVPGVPDLTKSYWTIDKTSYILKETSSVNVYLLDKLGVNLGTLEGNLDKEKSNINVITNKLQDYSYNFNSINSDNINYKYTYEETGDYVVKVTYNGELIGEEKSISVNYQTVDMKSSKFYYNIGDDDVLMLTTTQTNINNLESYPYYKFYLYTNDGEKITLYDKTLEAKCVMTYGEEKWEMVVDKLDQYLNISYQSGFEEKFSKLPLGKYYIELTFNNEVLKYPLYLLGEQDVSSSSDYDLSKTYVKPTEIEATAGEEKEVLIEFRASDGLRWNYEINTVSFGISNSYNLESDELKITVTKGDKNGRLKLKIVQTKATTGNNNNILTMSYLQKTISQTISLKIKSAEIKSLSYDSGAEDGTVINPPTLKFIPYDEYGNICTQVFDSSEYTQDKLNNLLKGISTDGYALTSNIYTSNGYLCAQYGSNKITTIEVTSDYFKETYKYKLTSGPIDSTTTFAQIIKYENVIAGDISSLNIYPKDKYENNVTSFTSSDIANFEVHYSLGSDASTTISKYCTKKEEDFTYINCETNITKSGDVKFGVDYSDIALKCINCEFTIKPDVLDFSKTKVVNQNTNKEMSQISINTLTVSVNPKFILSFYDRFLNAIIDEEEIQNLEVNTKIEVTDIKLCVENSNLNKISFLCKSSPHDENEEKWKYVPNGNSYKYIAYIENQNLEFPVQITGGYSDGSAGPIDVNSTYINPTSLTLIAGKEGAISLELRTKDNVRKNYWFLDITTHLGAVFPDDIKDCLYTISKGTQPGQYTFLFTCTQKRDSFETTIIVENENVPQKVAIKVVPNEPALSELYTLEGTKISNKNLGSVSVEEKFQMLNKLYDKYNNLITNIDFDLSILKLKISPSSSVKNYEYSVEPLAQKTGEVLITIKSTYAGEHIVSGALLPLTDYSITFTHGEPSADNSILEVSKKTATAGETIYIYITPYDKYSNLIDANEYKETSPYQVKYTNEGNTTKLIMEKHNIEVKDNINVISYPGAFYVKGYTNFYGYLDTQQIKCISCRVEIQSGNLDFKSSLVMRYDSSRSAYEILKDGVVEKNAQEEPIYRLYPRDQYLNSIDYIPEEKLKTFTSRLESQFEDTTYHFKLNNKNYESQTYAEFVVNENSETSYTNLARGYYNLIFYDNANTLTYNISLLGDGKQGSSEDADYQKTHINDQNLKFIAGETGYIMLEIRTAKDIRKTSWNYEIKVESCNKEDDTFQATSSKAGLSGVFQVIITTKKANTYPKIETCPLKIYINNTLVENLKPEMEVSPNEVVETKILEKYFKTNSNTELLDGNADTSYKFEVASYDQYENLAETNQDTIGLKVTYKGGSEYKTTSENDESTGYRKYSLSATKSGTYIISTSKSGSKGIYMKNEATFLINPGSIDLTKTVIKEKTTPIQAGTKPVISIVAYDKYGNQLDYTNYITKFSTNFIDPNNNEFNSTPSYDSGIKKVFYTSDNEATKVGNIKVEVVYDNKENVDASSIIIVVIPGDPYPPNSILSRETSSGIFTEYNDKDSFEVNVKETLQLNVTLYDKYKNYVNNLPANAEVLEPILSGNKMNPITFTVLKNTGNFDLDFNSDSKYVYIYQHLIKGTYDLTYKVKSSLGENDFHYYLVVNTGDDLHGNGDYVVSKCVLKPTETSFIAGNYEKFTLELRTEEGLLYNDDIDIEKDISIGEVDDSSFKYQISKSGSDYGIYIITIYSEKKGEYNLNVAITDPSSSSGQKSNLNSASYKVTPDIIPDKTKTQITRRPESSVSVDTPLQIQFDLYDKFGNKIEKSDNIIQISYFSLINNDEPYTYTSLNLDDSAELNFMPKYPPKTMKVNLLYNNGEKTVYIFNNDIEINIDTTIDYMKTQIISSNKEKITAGEQLDMWLYTFDSGYKCLDNGDLSDKFEIEIIGPLDSSKQYTRTFKVKKTKITEEGSSECNNEYKIDNETGTDPDPVYKYAGNYLIKVKYDKTHLIGQFNQVCYPLSYDIKGFNLIYSFNPDTISILDTPSFTITGTDKYGNKVSDALYSDIDIKFTYNNKESEFNIIQKSETQKGSLNYQISINKVGSYQLHIYYKEVEVEKVNNFQENLPIFTILTGPCYAENNDHFDLSNLNNTEISVKTYFTFQCYDKYNNKISKGGEKFTIKAVFSTFSNQGDTISLDNVNVIDNGDGSYKVEFVPEMKGIYLFNLLLGKEKYGQTVRYELTSFKCSGEENVLCPNQKKCVKNILECIEPPSDCDISTPFNCTVNGEYTCVKSQTDCDCPDDTYIKCDIMHYCVKKERQDMCPSFKNITANCVRKNLVYNFDGVCRINESGPNQRVCPIGKKLCPDLSCRDSLEECVETEKKSGKKQRCIGQQLVSNAYECPSSKTCSSKDEVVCPTGECVSNEIYCPSLNKCNEDYPYLCQNNICATEFKTCAESISCGENKLLCADNICRESC